MVILTIGKENKLLTHKLEYVSITTSKTTLHYYFMYKV